MAGIDSYEEYHPYGSTARPTPEGPPRGPPAPNGQRGPVSGGN